MLKLSRRLAIPALAVALAANGTSRAAEAKGGLTVDLGFGFDSNPQELPAGGPGGAFWEVDVHSRLGVTLGDRAGFFLGGSAAGRRHESDVDLADDQSAEIESGFAFTPYRRGGRHLSLRAGGRLGMYRATFVDPATGGEFLWGSDPATAVPLGARFDHNVAAGFLDLRFRSGRRVLWLLDGHVERRAFVNDYDATSLEPLDDRTVIVRPGARLLLSESVVLEVAAPLILRDYASLSALDAAGDAVLGVPREYRTTGLDLSVQVEPSKRWDLAFGLSGYDRADQHAGYYDSSGLVAFASVACFPGARNAFRLFASHSELDYTAARVDGAVNGVLRGGTVVRGRAQYERELAPRFSLVIEAGALRSDNTDPLYKYDQRWARSGIRFRL